MAITHAGSMPSHTVESSGLAYFTEEIGSLRQALDTLRAYPGTEDLALQKTVATLLGECSERKEPLRRLTDWRLALDYRPIDISVIISFLKFLTELRSMDVPAIENCSSASHTKIAEVARQIVSLCPRLRHLSKHHKHHDAAGSMAFAIAEAMAENTPRVLSFQTIRKLLQRQSGSLRSLILDDIFLIDTDTLKSILFKLPALEVFKISAYNLSQFKVSLEDLISQQ
ncbi:hypothetical protein BGX23_002680 [Mortierella sp. AD031]|nr:hypothetical protein BGX23_002680 [Mortierella sp. AD031]KAG0196928.1 hypothetical protein BGX33_001140 [Mortierella sp. NVP41]